MYLSTRLLLRAPELFHPVPPSLIEGLYVEHPDDMEIDEVSNSLLESQVYTWHSEDDLHPQPGAGIARLDFYVEGLGVAPLQDTPSHSDYLAYNVCPTCVRNISYYKRF